MSVGMTDYNFNFFCLVHVFLNNKSEVGNIHILAPSTVCENLYLSCKDKLIIPLNQIETILPHFLIFPYISHFVSIPNVILFLLSLK